MTAITEPYTYAGPYARYPNLTACAFDGRIGVPGAWTPEQCARIASAEFELTSDDELRTVALPSLTSLTLRFRLPTNRLAILAGATRLLALNASSLTHLSVAYSRLTVAGAPMALPALAALRSLDLHGCADLLARCGAALLPQLTVWEAPVREVSACARV